MRLGWCFSAAVLLVGHAWGATAADRPPAMPAHDASVTYRVEPAGRPVQVVHVYFGANGKLLRIDGPGGQGDTILDRASGLLTVVMNAQRAYMEIPSRGPVRDPFLLSDDMAYTRAGTTETVAGVGCTDWRMTSPKGPSTACVTADGLLLAASGSDGSGGQGKITALAVTPGALAAGVFTAPPGYARIAHAAPPAP